MPFTSHRIKTMGSVVIQKPAVAVFAVAVVLARPVIGAEVDCLYDSNSEWPWIDSRVCQVEDRPLIFNDQGTPVCSTGRADKDGDGWGWENDQSCKIDPDLQEKSSDVPVQVVEQEDLVVFEQDFETASVGLFTKDVLNEQWETPLWHMGIREERVKIVQDAEKGKAMEVLFPAHQYGSKGAVGFLNDLSFGVDFQRTFEELYVSYDVKFSENFEFVLGGKLPGLCGYNTTQEPGDGCNTGGGFPTGYDGWSGRGMWREDGVLENYMYHADQFYEYGDDEIWDVKPVRGQWHTIQHRIVMNTVGEANGVVEAWFDGVKVLSSTNMLYRKTADIGINLFYFSTFYGGADPSWAPGSDQYMYYDNFRIATTPLEASDEITTPVSTGDIASAQSNKVETVELPASESTQNLVTETVNTDTETDVADTTTGDIINTNLNTSTDLNTNTTVITDITDTTANTVVITSEVQNVATGGGSVPEPELGAANEVESSGGGVFFSWCLGLLLLHRRRRAVSGAVTRT